MFGLPVRVPEHGAAYAGQVACRPGGDGAGKPPPTRRQRTVARDPHPQLDRYSYVNLRVAGTVNAAVPDGQRGGRRVAKLAVDIAADDCSSG
jgi:hypothetical protein